VSTARWPHLRVFSPPWLDDCGMTVIADDEHADLMRASTRLELWLQFIGRHQVKTMAELGVLRGRFAERVLKGCPDISTYYLIDPWKHLDDWKKPANKDDETFENVYNEAMTRTQPWESKRVILRGRTTEVVHAIPDGSLDLAYVDADHTLRGISIDLIRIWPKVRAGGFIGGDDFCPSIWQHHDRFEPTLVYPFAVYFAEAVDAPIVALPHNQYLIQKVEEGFTFSDTTGRYPDPTLQGAHAQKAGHRWGRLPQQLLRQMKRPATP